MALFLRVESGGIAFDFLKQAYMKRVRVVEQFERNDGDDDQEEIIEEHKIEEVLTNDKDGIDYYAHLFATVAEYGKDLHYRNSPQEVSHDEISIGDPGNDNDHHNNEVNYVTL